MQKCEGDQTVLRNICEGIRKSILEKENVVVGLIVLVESGRLLRTTSGKIRRLLAKDSLLRAKMSTIMQMDFKDEDCDLTINNNAREEKGGLDKIKGRNEVLDEDKLGIMISLLKAPTNVSLLSSL
ncbi:hypothetical protein ACH5RR_027368 [Cinchona calisaya]|uniref:Uncharacterized protein n=1 Tax=Cinchona calisaya TaxID=153742 RepID=A0ABD2Z582_9GENT